jgi:hypothetical protein
MDPLTKFKYLMKLWAQGLSAKDKQACIDDMTSEIHALMQQRSFDQCMDELKNC